RVYPSTTAKKKPLRKWFGTARWTYNQCLDAVETKKIAGTKKDLRAIPKQGANRQDGQGDIRDAVRTCTVQKKTIRHSRLSTALGQSVARRAL
ncbi:hypothetical protein V1524DRAFT_362903, partial [Lipomyces starkeyi]